MLKTYLYEIKQNLRISLPFIANLLLQISVAVIDTIMAGDDGDLTLAAVAIGATLLVVTQLIVIGLTMPLTPMIARSFAQGNAKKIREIFTQGVWLTAFLGVLGIILIWLSPLLMQLTGIDEKIIPPATDYLLIISISMPFFALYLPIRYLNEGIGNAKTVMYITALSIPINVIGNYIFLNGLFGLPKMGAAGIAISSVLSIIFVCIFGWLSINRQQATAKFELLKNFSAPQRQTIYRFIRLGAPNAVALLMEQGMFASVSLLSGRLGVLEAAANQIIYTYISIVFMIPLGISLAMMTRIGMAVDENDKGTIRIIGLSGIILGAIIMVFSIILIFSFGEAIVDLFTDDYLVSQAAMALLTLAAIFQIPDGIQVCGSGALRGMEETKAPMKYAIIGYWILAMPLAIFLAFQMNLGAQGLWVGLLVGLSITSIFCTRKFLQLTSLPASR